MLAAYTGHEALTFPDYIDLGTGKTLAAVPGGTYDVAPASGRNVPDVPAGWFAPVVALSYDTRMLAQELAEGETGGEEAAAPAAAEPDVEPAHDVDPETEPQQF